MHRLTPRFPFQHCSLHSVRLTCRWGSFGSDRPMSVQVFHTGPAWTKMLGFFPKLHFLLRWHESIFGLSKKVSTFGWRPRVEGNNAISEAHVKRCPILCSPIIELVLTNSIWQLDSKLFCQIFNSFWDFTH